MGMMLALSVVWLISGRTFMEFPSPVRLLWLSSICLVLGRAIQAVWGNSGIVDFLAFESISGIVVKLFIPWERYVSEVYPFLAEGASWGILFIYMISLLALISRARRSGFILPGWELGVIDFS